jgi:3,2-trans-enoyl-CoA isomerase
METLQLSYQENFAIVQLNRGSSNPINLQMFLDLQQTFQDLQANDAVKGVVLTGKENFFSAGLDVIELYQYDAQKIELLFDTLFSCMRTLLAFDKPLVASITGHSPAGGCVLAICADYRVMAQGKYRIGLNEIPVGIIMPQYIFETYAFWLGRGKANQFILEGKLANNEEALQVGLVDAVVPAEEVLATSIAQLKKYMSFNENTWRKSKALMRSALLQHYTSFDAGLKRDLMEGWWSTETRAILGALVAQLTKK